MEIGKWQMIRVVAWKNLPLPGCIRPRKEQYSNSTCRHRCDGGTDRLGHSTAEDCAALLRAIVPLENLEMSERRGIILLS